MFRCWQNATQNFLQSRPLKRRRHLLSVSLR
jgi:hypothetical protein